MITSRHANLKYYIAAADPSSYNLFSGVKLSIFKIILFYYSVKTDYAPKVAVDNMLR